MSRIVAEMSRASLRPGVHLVDDGSVILWVGAQGAMRAAYNRCKHQGARLVKREGCTLRCPRHDWVLDASKMVYLSPRGNVRHPELRVVRTSDAVQILDETEALESPPWGGPPRREAMSPGEFVLRFYAHACIEIEAGANRLFTDPWLQGPAFIRGWWLSHRPPADWLDRLRRSDGIYISHSHSDHLNVPTLGTLREVRPDIPIYVPAFDSGSCARELSMLGLTNVRLCRFDTWVELSDGLRFMPIQDRTDRDDSAVLIEYRGRRVMNTVDCHNLGGRVPHPVDVLLTQFAGGASGYPVCWGELLDHDAMTRLVRRNRVSARRQALDWVRACEPSVYVPFANYFCEAHPADADIRAVNVKNTPEDVGSAVRAEAPDVRIWVPTPGGTLDVADYAVCPPPSGTEFAVPQVQRWTERVQADVQFAPLKTLEGLQTYFDWAGYHGDLRLHVVETSEDFRRRLRAFSVDFRANRVEGCAPYAEVDRGDVPYLRMRVRQDVFRHVLRRGLPWEEISIGFQARFFRKPDIYHMDFWDHFQNHLPNDPPRWNNQQAA